VLVREIWRRQNGSERARSALEREISRHVEVRARDSRRPPPSSRRGLTAVKRDADEQREKSPRRMPPDGSTRARQPTVVCITFLVFGVITYRRWRRDRRFGARGETAATCRRR